MTWNLNIIVVVLMTDFHCLFKEYDTSIEVKRKPDFSMYAKALNLPRSSTKKRMDQKEFTAMMKI